MSEITLSPEIQKEIEERRAAVSVAKNAIRNIDNELSRLIKEMDVKKAEWQRISGQIETEIALIIRVAQSCGVPVADLPAAATPLDAPAQPPRISASDIVLGTLARHREPLKHAAICEATGLPSGTVGPTLRNLRLTGAVSHDRVDHVWSIGTGL